MLTDKKYSLFAQELRAALASSRMSAQTVVEQLNNRGYVVPVKTFSYWLQGYYLPRVRSSFQLVATVEKICGVKGKTLCDALLYDLSSGKSFLPGGSENVVVPELPADLGGKEGVYFSAADSETDWDSELIREAIEDVTVVSADYLKMSHTNTIFGYVPVSNQPSLQVSTIYGYHDNEELPDEDHMIYGITGASIADQTMYEEDGIVNAVTSLSLPYSVAPGDFHTVSYTCDYIFSSPSLSSGNRYFVFPLSVYSWRVIFEGEPPKRVEYVAFSYDGEVEGEKIVTPIDVKDNAATVSLHDVHGFVGTIRWEL